MKQMFSNKKYNYYIAYAFITEDKKSGFGNLCISNNKKLSINTLDDMHKVEEFIKNHDGKNKLKDIVIMDWRRINE